LARSRSNHMFHWRWRVAPRPAFSPTFSISGGAVVARVDFAWPDWEVRRFPSEFEPAGEGHVREAQGRTAESVLDVVLSRREEARGD
jgi:hypothetical protein